MPVDEGVDRAGRRGGGEKCEEADAIEGRLLDRPR